MWFDDIRSIAETAADPEHFGMVAIHTPTLRLPNSRPQPDPGRPAYEITGVHDDPFVFAGDANRKREEGLREMTIASTMPWFDAPTDRWTWPPTQGDGIRIKATGRSYRVLDVRNPMPGITRLMLEALERP